MKLAPGTKRCKCTACERYFSTPNNFDRHRRALACVDPETVGLVKTDGIWRLPGRPSDINDARPW